MEKGKLKRALVIQGQSEENQRKEKIQHCPHCKGLIVGNVPTKERLLNHYSKSKVTPFFQFDGNKGECFSTITWELMNAVFPIRILVRADSQQADAVKTIQIILDWLKKDTAIFEMNLSGFDSIIHPSEEESGIEDAPF